MDAGVEILETVGRRGEEVVGEALELVVGAEREAEAKGAVVAAQEVIPEHRRAPAFPPQRGLSAEEISVVVDRVSHRRPD